MGQAKAGYEYLLSYKLTVPIYDYTVTFCTRCSPFHRAAPNLPNFPNLPNTPEIATNLMITLINQAIYFLDKLILALKEKHTREGGLTEELYRKRITYRNIH